MSATEKYSQLLSTLVVTKSKNSNKFLSSRVALTTALYSRSLNRDVPQEILRCTDFITGEHTVYILDPAVWAGSHNRLNARDLERLDVFLELRALNMLPPTEWPFILRFPPIIRHG